MACCDGPVSQYMGPLQHHPVVLGTAELISLQIRTVSDGAVVKQWPSVVWALYTERSSCKKMNNTR